MDIASIVKNAPVAAAPAPVQAPLLGDQRALIQAVKAVNAAELLGQDSELTFVFDRASRRAVVRIVNRETREVIRQVPDEYVLRLAEKVREW